MRYCEMNLEELREYHREYRDRNRERIREIQRRWNRNNGDIVQASHKKYASNPVNRQKKREQANLSGKLKRGFPPPIKCAQCGSVYHPKVSGVVKFCSKRCGNANWSKRNLKRLAELQRKYVARKPRPKKLSTPKICMGCKVIFVRNKGPQRFCKRVCYQKWYRRAFPEIRKRGDVLYRKRHAEKIKQRQAKWNSDNIDRLRLRRKEEYKKRRGFVILKAKRFAQDHPFKMNAALRKILPDQTVEMLKRCEREKRDIKREGRQA